MDYLDSERRGGNVSLDNGQFLVSEPITLGHLTQIRGESLNGSQVKQEDGAGVDVIEYNGANEDVYFGGLFDLKIHGNKQNNTSGDGVHIYQAASNDVNDWHMSRVFIDYAPDKGFNAEFCWGYHASHILVERCGSDGFYIAGGSQNYLTDMFLAYNDGSGMRLRSRENSVSGIRAQSNGAHGIFVQSGHRSEITNCTALKNWTIGIGTGRDLHFCG